MNGIDQFVNELASAYVPGAIPNHVYMDVARFHAMRGEPIPIALAGHGTGIHIEGPANDHSPATWHYITDCDEECP